MNSRSTRWGPMLFVFIVLLSAGVASGSVYADPTNAARLNSTANQVDDSRARILASAESYWRGQEVYFDATAIVDSPATTGAQERTFSLWSVENGEYASFIKEFVVNETGEAVIDTRQLTGDIVIRYDGDPVQIETGQGRLAADESALRESTFHVKSQTLSASLTDSSLFPNQLTDLRISSNRENYRLAVSSRHLSFQQLTALIPERYYAENYDVRSEEGVLILQGSTAMAMTLDTTGLETGLYSVTLQTVDSSARATWSITVDDPDPAATFVDVERAEAAGDLIDLTVSCDECYLFVGGEYGPLFDVAKINDTDDGNVSFQINTRYLGTRPNAQWIGPNAEVFLSEGNDTVTRLHAGTDVSLPRTSGEYSISEVRTDLGLAPQGRDTSVDTGTIGLYLSTTRSVATDRALDPFFVFNETDAGATRITEPTLANLQSGALAPIYRAQRRSPAGLRDRVTETSELPRGSYGILQVEVSGVFSYLLERSPKRLPTSVSVTLTDARGNIRNLHDPTVVDYTLVTDENRDVLSLVFSNDKVGYPDGLPIGDYSVEVTVSPTDQSGAFPTLSSTLRANRDIAIVPAESTLQLSPVSGERSLVASGETNLPQGSVLSVTSGVGHSRTVTVQEGGTWETTLSFQGYPREPTYVLVAQAGPLARQSNVSVQRVATPTPPTTTKSPPTTTAPTTTPPTTTPGGGVDGTPRTATEVPVQPDGDGGSGPQNPLLRWAVMGGVVVIIVLALLLARRVRSR